MEKVARSLLQLAFALLLLSLPLPSLLTDSMHGYLTIRGWQASAFAFAAWYSVLDDTRRLVVAMSSMLNLLFPLAVWLVLMRPALLLQHIHQAIALACFMGLFAVWAPYSLPEIQFTLLLGYFVWIAAHIALLTGLVLLSVNARSMAGVAATAA